MKKRIFFSLLWCLIILRSVGQDYVPMLAGNNIVWSTLCLPGTSLMSGNEVRDLEYRVTGDAVVNGLHYKIVESSCPSTDCNAFMLREDSATKKVWYKELITAHIVDTSEYLWMDCSLQVGDTFDFRIPAYGNMPGTKGIVDSIYGTYQQFAGGAPHIYTHIRFNKMNGVINEKIEFVEGVGCTLGFKYRSAEKNLYSDFYLLCKWQDGHQSYQNRYFLGACYPFGAPVKVSQIIEPSEFKLFPNPAAEVLNLSWGHSSKVDNISIYSMPGQEMVTKRVSAGAFDEQMNISELPVGCYLLRIQMDDGRSIHRRFIKK